MPTARVPNLDEPAPTVCDVVHDGSWVVRHIWQPGASRCQCHELAIRPRGTALEIYARFRYVERG